MSFYTISLQSFSPIRSKYFCSRSVENTTPKPCFTDTKQTNVNSFISRFHPSLDNNYLWGFPVLDDFQNNLLRLVLRDWGIARDFLLIPFLPWLKEGDISLALHLSEHFSKTGAGNAASVSAARLLLGKKSKVQKLNVRKQNCQPLGFLLCVWD